IDPRVVARLDARARQVLEPGPRQPVEAPAFGAVIAGRLRPVQRPFALAAVERAEVTAAERYPHDAVAIDVGAAHAETRQRRRVDLGECRGRRIRTRIEPNDRARVTEARSPHGAVD